MARVTKAELEKQIEELQAEIKKWQGYHLEVLTENGKLRDQLDSKQISEHSGTIQQLESELKTQKEVNRHLRESLAKQREKLSAKDNMIDLLRKQIQEPVSDLHPEEPKRGTSGRPRKKISQEQEQEILSLLSQGYSQRIIAKQYNISAAYVAKISKRRQKLSEPF